MAMKNTSKAKKQPGDELAALSRHIAELEKLEMEREQAVEALQKYRDKSRSLTERKFEILIVDDDANLASNLQDILEGKGYTTAVANDGQTALTLCREKLFDLALIDVKLPDIPGTKLIRKLSELRPGVEYIIITGYASLDTAVEAAGRREIVSYETKPLDMNRLLSLIKQVAERKRAETELRENRHWLSTTLRSIGDAVITTNTEGCVTLINPVAQTLTGCSEEDAIGRPLQDVFNIINEKTGKPAENPVARVIREGVVIGLTDHTVLIAKDGTKQSIDDSGAPIRGDRGNVIGVVLVFRDITESKRAKEGLLRAAEEWRATFDSITDLVSIHSKDFQLTRVNKAFADACNMKPKELIGKHCYEVMHGTNEPIPLCPLKKTILTKKPATADYFEPRLGVHLEVTTSPIFNNEGHVATAVHVARDITERKQMEARLMVTDRLASVGELASGIAHELNNPLTSVIGFSQLLLEQDMPEGIKEDIETVHREAQRAAEVVKNLLTFARKHPLTKQPVNINEVIENTLKLRAYEQKVNNIRVNTRLAPDLPEVMADNFQLQQVFLNIIINAEHFMIEAHNRGTLTITTKRSGDMVTTSFADDGPGIPQENLGHLFDPFFTTKEVGQGTGLGLSICHGIISGHGGRIYAKSEPGKGATFVVELPIAGNDKKGDN
jgi:PAS domain S-box-containing protein